MARGGGQGAAWEWVESQPAPLQRWSELVAASRASTSRSPASPRRAGLARRDDRWAVADRVAWQQASMPVAPELRPLVDALERELRPIELWSGASPTILDALEGEAHLDQLLARALRYRLVTESLGRADRDSRQAIHTAAEPVVDLVLARLAGSPPPPMGFLSDAEVAPSPLRPSGGRSPRPM